jgi:hypothetical protein
MESGTADHEQRRGKPRHPGEQRGDEGDVAPEGIPRVDETVVTRGDYRILIAIVGIGLAMRLVWALTVPLLDGETYYWLWSRTPALSYLDHPPFVAYMIRLTTLLGDDRIWVRLGPLLVGIATTLTLFHLGREMFGVRAGLIAALVYQITPVLAGGGLFATPETPLFLWWAVALLAAWRALSGRPRWWLVMGVAVGLGMLSKLTMIVLPVGMLGFAAVRRRDVLREVWVYLGGVAAVVVASPVVIWNATNDWPTLRYVLHGRAQQVPTGTGGLLAIAVEQLAFTGIVFLLLWWIVVRAFAHRRDEPVAFLLWASVPTMAVVAVVVAGWGGAHGYWLAPAYLALAVLLGGLWPGRGAAIVLALNSVLMGYLTLVPLVPSLPVATGAVESVSGWKEAAARAQALAAELPEPVVLAVPRQRFEDAAQLAYYTKRRFPVTNVPAPFTGSVFPPPSQFSGASVVLVVVLPSGSPPPEQFLVDPVDRGSLPIVVRGREIRRFQFWTGAGFSTKE